MDQIASEWLHHFEEAMVKKDVLDICNLFLQDGWLRDSLVFNWDVRSLEGHDKIAKYLHNNILDATFIPGFKLDETVGLQPKSFSLSVGFEGIEFGFWFETPAILIHGYARIQEVVPGSWKALTVYIAAHEIKGHGERGYELGLYHGVSLGWTQVNAERRRMVERDPQVLVGQTGLQIASRLQEMDIRTIVIERNARVGQVWRQRYPTLSLNTPRTHHTLLYAPYPSNWPKFAPRDKVAAWLEYYADIQDLVVWTSTVIQPSPTFDYNSHQWTVSLLHGDELVTVKVADIVLATGTLGDPFIPNISIPRVWRERVMHASTYQGSLTFRGKKVLVVGSGTTAADIVIDLQAQSADEITMLQRSPTCVVSRELADTEFRAWPEGVPVEVSDFRVAAMPLGLSGKIAKTGFERQRREDVDRDLREGLKRSGFLFEDGPNGGGRRELVYERLGGYWVDVGAAKLIIDGKVQVKSGIELARFDPNGLEVHFNDGSKLQCEQVIFATGYENIRTSMRKLFGSHVIDETSLVWGLDDEGELKGCYRPSGHPGLWFGGGDFFFSRYMSKQLAILIKADHLGLKERSNLASVLPEHIRYDTAS